MRWGRPAPMAKSVVQGPVVASGDVVAKRIWWLVRRGVERMRTVRAAVPGSAGPIAAVVQQRAVWSTARTASPVLSAATPGPVPVPGEGARPGAATPSRSDAHRYDGGGDAEGVIATARL